VNHTSICDRSPAVFGLLGADRHAILVEGPLPAVTAVQLEGAPCGTDSNVAAQVTSHTSRRCSAASSPRTPSNLMSAYVRGQDVTLIPSCSSMRRAEARVVTFMLGRCPDVVPASELGDHSYVAYLTVENVDDYHARAIAERAEVLKAPTDEPWGRREMGLRSPDGHRFMLGERIQQLSD
jgi:uncharacterized glyoxalase superfamily protein PhnB